MKTTILSLGLAVVGAAVQAQDTTYTFVSNDGGSSITGTLTLDSPSSPLGGGTSSDVVNFSVTDPVATYTIADLFLGGITSSGTFSWNLSGITDMSLVANTYNGGLADEFIDFEAGGLSDEYFFLGEVPIGGFSESGSWQRVPDAGSTAMLLSMALSGLAGYRRLRR